MTIKPHRPPRCVCCGWRARHLSVVNPGGSCFYLDFCLDCVRAAQAIKAGKPIPRIYAR